MKTIINLLTKILAFFMPKRFVHLLTYETVSYLFFGGLTTIVGFGSFVLFRYYDMGIATANSVSNVLAIIFAYITNKIFVFESPSWRPKILLPEVAKFSASRLLVTIVENFVLMLLVDMLDFNDMLMKVFTVVFIVVIGNYALSKWVVFTNKG